MNTRNRLDEPAPTAARRPRFSPRRSLAAALLACAVSTAAATAQVQGMLANPVYLDESPAAVDADVRVRELIAAGNNAEAARVLQALLDDDAERVVAQHKPKDAVFVTVRRRVHETLRADPALLEQYRAQSSAAAKTHFDTGWYARVERSYLLTPSGFDAALRIAQSRLEDAQFEGARLTLLQLESHPDAKDERAGQCAALWLRLAKYLDRPDVRVQCQRWSALAGLPAQPKPEIVAWPPLATQPTRSTLGPLPALDTSGLVGKSPWTVEHAQPRQRETNARMRQPAGIPPMARALHVLPSAAGDVVYLNDGTTISAYDRFTLSARWTVSPAGPEPAAADDEPPRMWRRGGMILSARSDEACTVSIDGRWVVAATGRASGGNHDGDDRLTGIDAVTGRMRWSTTLAQIDPNLADGVIRGPVELVENTAVIAVRKQATERRLISLTLIGLDSRTGATRWSRPIASTGSMPWVGQSGGAETMLAKQGVVYRVDRLGVVFAVEAFSGRVLWIRRMPVDPSQQVEPSSAFQLATPIEHEGSLIVFAPDGRRLLRINPADGEIIEERSLADLGEQVPKYAVLVGSTLALVGDDRVRMLDAGRLKDGPITAAPRVDDPGIRGRVLSAGSMLLVPTASTVTFLDPRTPADPKPLELDAMGNVLALESQLVVVDDARVHSYLKWDTAESILSTRVKNEPADPQPATTLAELAFRAGKTDRIAPAIDAAMSALKLAPPGEDTTSSRDRLFNVMHTIAASTLEPADASSRPQIAPPVNDPALITRLVDRMGELAATPDQRVSQVLATGRNLESFSRYAEAAAAYQRVLSDPALFSAVWRAPGASVRGELEATRRLETLIKAHGPGVYAALDADAAQKLVALGLTPASDRLEALAGEYPFASQTPSLWLRAAEAHSRSDNPRAYVAALEAGLRAARRVPNPDLQVVGELGGRLTEILRSRGQVAAAYSLLKSLRSGFPGAPLTTAAAPIDADALFTQLGERLAQSQRWPRVGPVRVDSAQTMPGWSIMEPILHDTEPFSPGSLALLGDDEIALWAAPAPGPSSQADAPLAKVWSMVLSGKDARLLKIVGDAAYFLVVGPDEGTLIKVAPGPAPQRWSIDAFARGGFTRDDGRGLRRVPGGNLDRFDTPSERAVAPVDLLIAMDERTIVLLQRSGKGVGIDTDSGELLWSAPLGASRVHDCDIAAGALVLAGIEDVPGPAGNVAEQRPAAAVIDARTGRAIQRIAQLKGMPSWVQLTESGSAIIGTDAAVACFDLNTGQPNWTIAGQDFLPATAGWVMGDQLCLLTSDRTLMLGSVATGRIQPRPLETPRTLLDGTRVIDLFPLAAGPSPAFAVATQQGIAFFDSQGALTGADPLSGSTTVVPPRAADGRAVTIETVSDGRAGEGMMFFNLMGLDAPIGTLNEKRTILLGARPSELALLDGRVAITAGSVTVILRAETPK